MIVTQMLNLFVQDGSQKLVSQNLLLGKSNSEHDELAKYVPNIKLNKIYYYIFCSVVMIKYTFINTYVHTHIQCMCIYVYAFNWLKPG